MLEISRTISDLFTKTQECYFPPAPEPSLVDPMSAESYARLVKTNKIGQIDPVRQSGIDRYIDSSGDTVVIDYDKRAIIPVVKLR